MYVVTKEGYKLPVDDSLISEDEFRCFQETVGLYDDSTVLTEVWILELNKEVGGTFGGRSDKYELEFVKELRYDHEPTKEEILWAMSAYGCSRWDIVFVKKGYELEYGDDEF